MEANSGGEDEECGYELKRRSRMDLRLFSRSLARSPVTKALLCIILMPTYSPYLN